MPETSRHTPTFNMKVVVQETGLKPDTLRAWERRYGMPNPERTAGGHRLYSQQEIDTLKWLIARQDEGLSISHAVELWHQLSAAGRNPLQQREEPPATETAVPVAGDQINDLRAAWLDACLNFDEQKAQHLQAQGFARFPLETVCFEVLQKGLAQIGHGWYAGAVTVQQEHFASSLAVRQLEALLVTMPPPARGSRILVACPPQENHTFSPLLLSLLLRRRGRDVVYLGANVPIARLETTIQSIEPELVILSAQTLQTAATLLAMAHALRQAGTALAFGGAVFAQVAGTAARIPGHYLGDTLEQAPRLVEGILNQRPALPEPAAAPAGYQAALDHFTEQRLAVHARLEPRLKEQKIPAAFLHNANEELANNIVAALALGSLDFLTANIAWVRGLLVSYHDRIPQEALSEYLAAYRQAIRDCLDDRGAPIVAWFDAAL